MTISHSQSQQPLSRGDLLLLAALCLILFGSCLFAGRSLTGHEAVQPQSAREMQSNGDWMAPTMGGLPWLERPPLPHWALVGVGSLLGGIENEWVARCVPIFFAVPIVLIVAYLASIWYGRAVGMATGAILATMTSFFKYATNPEADMFLCLFVTGAVVLFGWLETRGREKYAGESTSFFGKRPWPVLAFFIVLGLTNWAKGLFFGTVMAGLPIFAYLVLQGRWHVWKRYLWVWGWLAFGVVWLGWAVAVTLRFPDVLELWRSDYVGRLNENFVGEPWWYYIAAQPRVSVPWSIAAFIGLYLTAKKAFTKCGPERLLWLWAILPPLFFSIPDGKHHHYLLQSLAPWAVLAGVTVVRLWRFAPQLPLWLRHPLGFTVIFGAAGDVAMWMLQDRIPGPTSVLVPVCMVVWPLVIFLIAWSAQQRDGRIAFAGVFGVVMCLSSFVYFYRGQFADSYQAENRFLQQVQQTVPKDESLLICADNHVLETFRLLYYSAKNSKLLHNTSFLLDSRMGDDEVFILARKWQEQELAKYGRAEPVLESPSRRGDERYPEFRRVLYRLRFHEHVQRRPSEIRVSVMQATHRAAGPFLDEISESER